MANVAARAHNTLEWLGSVPKISVPVFQRDYRWTSDMCGQLLSDVRRIACFETGRSHFIGSILAVPEAPGG